MAPPLIKLCQSTLKEHHSDWEIVLLDQNTVWDWSERPAVSRVRFDQLPLAHQSDLIRNQLLIQYGGVWSDPTIYYTDSLNTWLDEALRSDVFYFSRPGPDRLIANWFIAAGEKANPLLVCLQDALCKFWNGFDYSNIGSSSNPIIGLLERVFKKNSYLPTLWLNPIFKSITGQVPYLVYHYLFTHLVRNNSDFRELWDEMVKISADGPHKLQRLGLLCTAEKPMLRIVESEQPPLFKLNWKLNFDELTDDMLIVKLFERSHQRHLLSGSTIRTA